MWQRFAYPRLDSTSRVTCAPSASVTSAPVIGRTPEVLRGVRELERAVHPVVVGERERLVAELGGTGGELLRQGCPVEERVRRMAVQLDVTHGLGWLLMEKALETRRGTLLADRPELYLELVADTPWLGASHGTLASGGPLPPPHVHREHADCFLVLEGGLRLLLADGEREVQDGAWVQVPAGVVHTFAPVGRVRMLNLHTPASGYSGYIQRLASAAGPEEVYRAREGFDLHDPPEDGGADPATAIAVQLGAGSGETIADRPGRRVTLLAETAEVTATEFAYGPGEQGPDLHVHHHHADVFVVLEGALSLAFEGASLLAPAGTVAVVPPLVAHGYANEGAAAVRLLNLHTPSCGFGDYLRGRNPGFDQHEPPPDGGGDVASVVVTRLAGQAIG